MNKQFPRGQKAYYKSRSEFASVYREKERAKAVDKLKQFLLKYGWGRFEGIKRNYVLIRPNFNLWHGIRYEALRYFDNNNIDWWENDSMPSGHILSSQIQCLNMLYPIQKDRNAALRVLRNIDPEFSDAELMDDGYVEFEYTGEKNYLGEISHTRGKNSTSIDAVMKGTKKSGERILIAIEWKYTECYKGAKNKLNEIGKGETRRKIYFPFISDEDTPFKNCETEDLFYEPFYQLMRQTLLAKEIAGSREKGISDYLHLHIIPKENLDLINCFTSPGLSGKTITEAWKNVLKEPEKYRNIDTKEFIKPIFENGEYKELKRYLDYRYFS
ncbi:MAG: hypothetical protein LWX07_03835 [Bacteroidetes bacterium]|nr:hypothetical protein [Bacteroidota bacterium]